MTLAAPLPRIAGALCVLGLSVGLLAACTPTPEPTPTPTALFASDEEAYAAAEETYRAYNDAGNAQRAGETASDPQLFLIGAALEGDIDGQRELEEAGLQLNGDVHVASFTPDSEQSADDHSRLIAAVCLDLSDTTVLLENGTEAHLPDRPQMIAQQVEMTLVDKSYRISAESEGEIDSCAA